ncbi:KATNB1 [Acrasis kona]|uniref:KATNB1 n=1 Tax=Acrasis kona TaxID=1008807 RepID=A0AAW2ZNN9_9EUKA
MNKRDYRIPHDKANCAKFSSTGSTFVTGGDDGRVCVWSENEQREFTGSSAVTSVAINEDESAVAVGSEGGNVKYINLDKNKSYRFMGHKTKVTCLEFHVGGDHLVSGSIDGTVKLWKLSNPSKNAQAVQCIKHGEQPVTALVCTPDGKYVISGSNDGKIKITDLTVNREKAILTGHTQAVISLRTHPEEETLASSSLDRTIRVWDLTKGEVIYVTDISSIPIRSVSFHPQFDSFAADGEKINFGTVTDTIIDKNTLFMKVISVASAGYINIHGIDLTTKLPWSTARQSNGRQDVCDIPDDVLIKAITDHKGVHTILSDRLKNFRIVKRLMLDERESRQAIINLVRTKDHAIAIDVMKQMMKPIHVRRFLTLDICTFLLPLLHELFLSPHEDYIITALRMATLLYECFYRIIRDTLNAGPGSVTDISQESRQEKCSSCKDVFEKLYKTANMRFKHQLTDMGSYSRQFLRMMNNAETRL